MAVLHLYYKQVIMYYMCITSFSEEINMQKDIESKREKYYATSIRLPTALYEQLELRSEEMGNVGVSETIRILLNEALKNSPLDFLNPKQANMELNDKIQYKILQNVVTCYYLLKEQVTRTEDGLKRDRIAHERSKKAMEKILNLTQSD